MDVQDKYQGLVDKTPVNRALDYHIVDEVIREVARKHYPEIVTIEKLDHVEHKRRVGKIHSTFIYSYYITGRDASGDLLTKHLIFSSHTDGSREIAFANMRRLSKINFNADEYKIIEPLEFRSDLRAIIYEAVAGTNLLQYMQQGLPLGDIAKIVQRTAQWIKKFHTFSVPESVLHEFREIKFESLIQEAKALIQSLREENKEQSDKLNAYTTAVTSAYKSLATSCTRGLVYGDLHPENIITDSPAKQGLTMIDPVDVSYGDQARDLGSFLQQFNFMGRQFYPEAKIGALRRRFLELYFEEPFTEISPDRIQQINLYQSWYALRAFVWLHNIQISRTDSYGLLEDAWLYLTLAREKNHSIDIVHQPSDDRPTNDS